METTPEIGALASRAMLVNLTVSFWHAKRVDRRLSDEVASRHRTQGDYVKRLLPRAALRRISAARTLVRKRHLAATLPWYDRGFRILRASAFDAYRADIRPPMDDFAAAADVLAAEWDSVVETRRRTDRSFRAAHYPTAAQVRAKYRIRLQFSPVPQGGDLRVEMDSQALAAVRQSIEHDVRQRTAGAMESVTRQVTEVVGRMACGLRDYAPAANGRRADNAFRDSLIGNVRELSRMLPRLNITNNPGIDRLAGELRQLTAETPQSLRRDAALREQTALRAEALVAGVQDYV